MMQFVLQLSRVPDVALAAYATYHLASSNREVNSMAKLVLPRVQAMVVCDALKESDEEQDVYHLNGVRCTMEVPSFPALRPRLCVFLQMSGHAGHAACCIRIERVETGEPIFQSAPKEIAFRSPDLVEPLFFRVRNCVFPEPGVYYVQVLYGEKVIGERPLHLREIE